jgi:hypothetical protein
MYKTSKSPRKVLLAALAVAQGSALPLYANQYSPKKFTQHQVFAILVLKEFLRCDYRKITALLGDAPDLCHAIGLQAVPHYTTLQKASRRLLTAPRTRALLDATLTLAGEKNSSPGA